MKKNIQNWLSNARPIWFASYAMIFSFGAYFSMYAFRKPFSVGTYEGQIEIPFLPAMDLKIFFIVSQVIGYTLSKFLGIKFVSEAQQRSRGKLLIGLIVFAEFALLLFALLPTSLKVIGLFLNGIPLGMIWGIVFSYLEGRKLTAVMGAGLSASYIVASGVVKSVGSYVMKWGVSEYWMPFVTGALFFVPLLIATFALESMPAPTKEEEAMRAKRVPMDGASRKKFLLTFPLALGLLTLLHMSLTAYRDFRDNFAREIWDELGFSHHPEIFALTEIPIAIVVIITVALLSLVKDSKKSFYATYAIMMTGTAIIGLSTFAFQMGWIDPITWMIVSGLGCFLAYVPYGSVFFDNLMAVVGFAGTAGFMIYVTDAFGYLGSVGLMLYKNFGHPNIKWLDFFVAFSYATAILNMTGFVVSLANFTLRWKKKQRTASSVNTVTESSALA